MRTPLSTRPTPLRDKLRRLRQELAGGDLSAGDRGLVVAQRAVNALGLGARVVIGRHVVYELRQPPPSLRGLRDLLVRPGGPADLPGLHAVDGRELALLRRRFDRGDLCYLADLEGRVRCHAWFHRGPVPFDEDRPHSLAPPLAAEDFWSYDAATDAESRHSGAFLKVFQTALLSLFREHGAARVLCMVQRTNRVSLRMHERLGFRRLGTVTALSLPLGKLLRLRAEDGAARTLLVGPSAEVLPDHLTGGGAAPRQGP